MNKEKFLEMLAAQLQVLDEKEKQDILDEYALHIDMKVAEGLSEEEAISDFGDAKELVADILEAYHVNPEYCTPVKVQKKEWRMKKEGIEVCAKARGVFKGMARACKEKCRLALTIKKAEGPKVKKEVHMREKKEKHMIKNIFGGCKSAVIWCTRVCWNVICFLFAATFVTVTIATLFGFGVLVILNAQGYPLTGVTVGTFGTILAFGALTGLALSFSWQKIRRFSMKRLQLILTAVLGTGVLLTGFGTGIALKEYSSLEYTGEHIVGTTNMQTKTGEVKFVEMEEVDRYQIFCGADEFEVIEDESVPDMVVRYEATYNADRVDIDVHGTAEDGYFAITSGWYTGSDFELWMSCKDEILKELKQNKIGSYRTMEIQKVKFTVNPKMAEMLYIE